jgi:hypothetical protein
LRRLLEGGDRRSIAQSKQVLELVAGDPRRGSELANLACDVEQPQKFVRAWALDSLATLARSRPPLMPLVASGLKRLEGSSSKALHARARHIRARLDA